MVTYEKQEDPNFLIIKRYINERDQDILFEHTRKLRELQKEKSSREARRNTPERGLDLPISPKESKKEVIFLKDPLNRTLILPFELCDTMDVGATVFFPHASYNSNIMH